MSGNVARNGIITLHAGDYFEAPLFLNVGYGCCPVRYTLQETDKVYVGIMEPNQPFEDALIRKVLTIKDLNRQGDPVLILRPDDTERVMPGMYYYEVKLLRIKDGSQEIIDTVVPKTKLYVLE